MSGGNPRNRKAGLAAFFTASALARGCPFLTAIEEPGRPDSALCKSGLNLTHKGMEDFDSPCRVCSGRAVFSDVSRSLDPLSSGPGAVRTKDPPNVPFERAGAMVEVKAPSGRTSWNRITEGVAVVNEGVHYTECRDLARDPSSVLVMMPNRGG